MIKSSLRYKIQNKDFVLMEFYNASDKRKAFELHSNDSFVSSINSWDPWVVILLIFLVTNMALFQKL